jgi:NDP-sugar pyrophosphorylase family protein
MQVVILAGGLGTRLGALAAQTPKALLPVAGRPFLAHVIELLKENGLTRILVLHGHHGEQLERALGDGSGFSVRISYRHDGPRLLGTAGALRHALDLLEDEFFVLYGDTYLDIDYQEVVRAFRSSGKPALMTVFHNRGQFDTSNVVFRSGQLLRYSKHERTPEMDHIDYGLAALRRELIAPLPANEASDLATLYTQLVDSGRMAGFEVHRRFYEIGTPAGLATAEQYLRTRGS